MLRMISAVQIILALVGLLLLFTTPFATYDAYHGSWYNYGIWYSDSLVTWSLTGISVVLLLLIAYSGFKRGWSPSAGVGAEVCQVNNYIGFGPHSVLHSRGWCELRVGSRGQCWGILLWHGANSFPDWWRSFHAHWFCSTSRGANWSRLGHNRVTAWLPH